MATRDTYLGNGSNRQFNISFPYSTKSDVVVTVDDAAVSFSFISPATIQTTLAPAAGSVVVVRRRTSIEVPRVVFEDGAVLTDNDLNNAIGQALNRLQEMDDEQTYGLQQALKVKPGDTLGTLPDAATRSGKFLAFSASGLAIAASGLGADAALRTDLAQPLGSDMVGARRRYAGAKSGRSVSDSAEDKPAYVTEFGAKGDGLTDDTAAFNAAIDTGRTVVVPYRPAGYVVNNVKVVNQMHIMGERRGISAGPLLIVTIPGASVFYNANNDNIFDVTIENLAATSRTGGDGYFYNQANITFYSAYFTFANIETYVDLSMAYRGLFIFTLWDRLRDGYLGTRGTKHGGIEALASFYGQSNRQNINRIENSMFFHSFGVQAAITMSYGTLLTIQNSDFEQVNTIAFKGYNTTQVRFENVWFEAVGGVATVFIQNYPGTGAASDATFDHCTFVMTQPADASPMQYAVFVEGPGGYVGFRNNTFALVPAGTKMTNDGTLVRINENAQMDGADIPTFVAGLHLDQYISGRRLLQGAKDNNVAAMNTQFAGGLTATAGFLSKTEMTIGTEFVTVATSATGLGGTAVLSGYDPVGGAQVRAIKDWQGSTVRDVMPIVNPSGKVISFQVSGNDLQMKVNTGTLQIYSTLLN